MKKALILLCAALLATAGLALGDNEWTGEVLDLKCYANGQKGEAHAGCAAKCLGGGAPMGLLVGDDVVKIDADGSDAGALETMKKLGGKNVTITGTATTADGETTVKVKSAKAA